jgi:signal peptidase I
MEDAILTGDKILVSKLSYGPAIPQSPLEIPWINALFYFFDNTSATEFTDWWPYCRLSGYSEVKLNDIVVFSMNSKKQQYIKRCVGLPGDTIRFIDGDCFFNDMRFTFPPTSKRYYEVWVNNSKSFCEYLTNNGISEWKEDSNKFVILLKQPAIATIGSLPSVDSVQIQSSSTEKFPNTFFLKIDSSWTVDNFGPYFIPKKGSVINLNSDTYNFFKYIINQYEGASLIEKDDGFYLANIKAQTYTFIQDYYFVIGDNISNSMDSRCWGLVPESALEGKAVVVLFSNTDSTTRWHRLLTTL